MDKKQILVVLAEMPALPRGISTLLVGGEPVSLLWDGETARCRTDDDLIIISTPEVWEYLRDVMSRISPESI